MAMLLALTCTHYPAERQLTPFVSSGWWGYLPPILVSRTPWRENELVPDVIDAPPPSILEVQFGILSVNHGNILTPLDVRSPPTHLSWAVDYGAFYTLLFIDPDAPSRKEPSLREFLHWMVGNMPYFNPNAGETIAGYISSAPPEGTGLHRYTFLMFKQPGKIVFDEPRLPNTTFAGRPGFNTREFVSKYRLQLVAGNFYQAGYDTSVDELHRVLGMEEESLEN